MKVGDKVIALTNNPDDSCQFRRSGSVYMVNAMSYCVMCMTTLVNIGQRSNHSGVKCKCGMLMGTEGLMWTPSGEFVLFADRQEALDKAVKEENYELAAKLRDV
jgi:hypothetical protein